MGNIQGINFLAERFTLFAECENASIRIRLVYVHISCLKFKDLIKFPYALLNQLLHI